MHAVTAHSGLVEVNARRACEGERVEHSGSVHARDALNSGELCFCCFVRNTAQMTRRIRCVENVGHLEVLRVFPVHQLDILVVGAGAPAVEKNYDSSIRTLAAREKQHHGARVQKPEKTVCACECVNVDTKIVNDHQHLVTDPVKSLEQSRKEASHSYESPIFASEAQSRCRHRTIILRYECCELGIAHDRHHLGAHLEEGVAEPVRKIETRNARDRLI
mmetsp:Transcript_17418/g.44610  ORF Transcript_17418/g.44610 Transcript_17418/m.44610 type:complete len:219 (-) Transcript_17418:1313-1969(-)